MPDNNESVVITGAENTEKARWLAVRSALKLEIKGFRSSGGRRSARVLANEITGKNCSTKRKAYDALNEHIVGILGEDFNRPL